MKRYLFLTLSLCFTLLASAQSEITVKFQGAKPGIADFVTAYLQPTYGEDGEETIDEYVNGLRAAWQRHRAGKPQHEGATFTLDAKNGFACYESRYTEEGIDHLFRIEMCFWNCADQKHKLFACSTWSYTDGLPAMGQYDGIVFFQYDNATHKMKFVSPPGFEEEYDNVSYSLPRTGRDIIVNDWRSGTHKTHTLKFNGTTFSK